MPYCRVGGSPFYYVEAGEGPALLLLHPIPLDHTVWVCQLLALASEFRVIAMDQRCFGRSVKIRTAFDIGRCGEDVAGVLDALKIDRADVVGISMGGIAAQLLALSRPERIRRMVLVSTTSHASGAPVIAERIERFGRDGVERYAREAVESLFSAAFQATAFGQYLVAALAERVGRLDVAAVLQFYAALAAFDVRARLKDIPIPTLVAAGTENFTFALSREIAAAIPGAQFVPFEGCGRVVPAEAPAAFNRLVRGFLAEPAAGK